MIPPIIAGIAVKHGMKLIAVGVMTVAVISLGSYIYSRGWNARDIIAKQEAAQAAAERAEIERQAMQAGSEKVAQVYSTRANVQTRYKEVIRYVPQITTGRPCLSPDAVRMLNSKTTGTEQQLSDNPEPVATESTGDAAVNQGKKAAVRMLQEALKIKQDGVIGQQTIKAAVAASDAVCADFLSIRAVRYANTANFGRFGRGWMRRLFVLALHTA